MLAHARPRWVSHTSPVHAHPFIVFGLFLFVHTRTAWSATSLQWVVPFSDGRSSSGSSGTTGSSGSGSGGSAVQCSGARHGIVEPCGCSEPHVIALKKGLEKKEQKNERERYAAKHASAK